MYGTLNNYGKHWYMYFEQLWKTLVLLPKTLMEKNMLLYETIKTMKTMKLKTIVSID